MSYFFTPGPSELYFTVPQHLQNALKSDVCSLSHRSKAFEAISKKATDGLRKLLGIPDSFHIVFTGSATEIWERLLQNCVEKETFHLVNGSFSTRFKQFSDELHLQPTEDCKDLGKGFRTSELPPIPDSVEAICVTHNETSTGVFFPVEEINALHDQYPDKLLFVDSVSSIPYPTFDWPKVDSVLFSVQKGMGLPAGLGVWIFNDRCVRKAEALEQKGHVIGTYHSIPSLLSKAAKHQTPETPNVLGIYLLGQVVEDMLHKGIDTIRQETERKAAALYQLFEETDGLAPAVDSVYLRSQTVAVAQVTKGSASELIEAVQAKTGYVIGSGYGKHKDTQIRIANFPTHSLEHTHQLIDTIRELMA